MRAGDLITHRYPDSFYRVRGETGIVVEVNHWVDKGAPDRNFGTDVKVLWSDGTIETYDESEIDLLEAVE